MTSDQASLKAFLHEAKVRAETILALDHINSEAKVAIKDLLQISHNYQALMSANVGVSSDVSLLKKRYEQAKADLKKAEALASSRKNILTSLFPEIVVVSAESNSMHKVVSQNPDHPMLVSVMKIKQATAKMAEIITQSQK